MDFYWYIFVSSQTIESYCIEFKKRSSLHVLPGATNLEVFARGLSVGSSHCEILLTEKNTEYRHLHANDVHQDVMAWTPFRQLHHPLSVPGLLSSKIEEKD